MERKPRSDSKLDSLPESRVEELRAGLLGDWRYDDALAWLKQECGVSSTLSALSAFYRRHCAPIVSARQQLAAVKAETITDGTGTDWDSASIERLRQMVFEFMARPNVDIDATERLFKLLLKSRDQEMDARRLKLLEAKAAQADAAAKVSGDQALTPEEKAARMKQIFGMG